MEEMACDGQRRGYFRDIVKSRNRAASCCPHSYVRIPQGCIGDTLVYGFKRIKLNA